jgi:predicted RNA-binding Zn-ribbon protein involved in translation (DUF1610 family)
MLRIQWSPRIKMAKLAQLYRRDAQGLEDEDLINEVGSGLFQRCRSILMVTDARQVDCPQCGGLIESTAERWSRENPVVCAACGFKASYGQWRDSWRNRELMGGSAVRIYRAYLEGYPKARTPAIKLLLIDQLIHAFHFSLRQGRTFRPVAQQLIDGSAEKVLGFLDRLSETEYATGDLNATGEEWRRNLEKAAAELPFLGDRVEQARRFNRSHQEDDPT